jgi:hypothetical protein
MKLLKVHQCQTETQDSGVCVEGSMPTTMYRQLITRGLLCLFLLPSSIPGRALVPRGSPQVGTTVQLRMQAICPQTSALFMLHK